MKARMSRNLSVMMATTAVLVATMAPGAAQTPLTVLDWPGYEDPALNPDYPAERGEPQYTFFADEDEAFEKLRSGFKADISHPCATNVVKWRDAGLLQPIDTSKLCEASCSRRSSSVTW